MVKKGQSALILNYLLECKVKKAAHDVEKGKAISSDSQKLLNKYGFGER
jgi:nitrite reductase/ring-hydroxylating ferredoxin subunit